MLELPFCLQEFNLKRPNRAIFATRLKKIKNFLELETRKHHFAAVLRSLGFLERNAICVTVESLSKHCRHKLGVLCKLGEGPSIRSKFHRETFFLKMESGIKQASK